MLKNISLIGGLHKSQIILLQLTQKGVSRQKAYSIIQKCAMESWNKNKDFEKILINNSKLKKYMNEKEIKKILKESDKIDNLDWIFSKKIK